MEKIVASLFVLLSIAFVQGSHAEILTGISGKIMDEISGEGIKNVLVIAESMDGKEKHSTFTTEQGIYSLERLKAGTYAFSFNSNDEHISIRYGLNATLPKGKSISNLNYYLKRGGSIVGIVTDTLGHSLSGSYIFVEDI